LSKRADIKSQANHGPEKSQGGTTRTRRQTARTLTGGRRRLRGPDQTGTLPLAVGSASLRPWSRHLCRPVNEVNSTVAPRGERAPTRTSRGMRPQIRVDPTRICAQSDWDSARVRLRLSGTIRLRPTRIGPPLPSRSSTPVCLPPPLPADATWVGPLMEPGRESRGIAGLALGGFVRGRGALNLVEARHNTRIPAPKADGARRGRQRINLDPDHHRQA
jgi:hypothetical protein